MLKHRNAAALASLALLASCDKAAHGSSATPVQLPPMQKMTVMQQAKELDKSATGVDQVLGFHGSYNGGVDHVEYPNFSRCVLIETPVLDDLSKYTNSTSFARCSRRSDGATLKLQR